jgi:hypothetical protein
MVLPDFGALFSHGAVAVISLLGGFLVSAETRVFKRKNKMLTLISDIPDYQIDDWTVLRIEPANSSFVRGWFDVELVALPANEGDDPGITAERLNHWKAVEQDAEDAKGAKVRLRKTGDDAMIRVHSRDRGQVRSSIDYVLRQIREYEKDPKER